MRALYQQLYLILWASLILIFDFYLNRSNFRIDIISDILGAILIFSAVYRISKIEIKNPSFSPIMHFVKTAAAFLILISIHDSFIYKVSEFMFFIQEFISIIIIVGIILFCIAMKIFSKEKLLEKSEKRWGIARNYFILINLIPTLIFSVLNWYKSLSGTPRYQFDVELGQDGLTLFIIILIALLTPVIYALYVIQAMRNEIREEYGTS